LSPFQRSGRFQPEIDFRADFSAIHLEMTLAIRLGFAPKAVVELDAKETKNFVSFVFSWFFNHSYSGCLTGFDLTPEFFLIHQKRIQESSSKVEFRTTDG
jgi:hypothetical protein